MNKIKGKKKISKKKKKRITKNMQDARSIFSFNPVRVNSFSSKIQKAYLYNSFLSQLPPLMWQNPLNAQEHEVRKRMFYVLKMVKNWRSEILSPNDTYMFYNSSAQCTFRFSNVQ